MLQPRFALGVAVVSLLVGTAISSAQAPKPAAAAPKNPVIVLDTAKGAIEIETFASEAPKSVAHILDLVRHGFYRGLRFHWVQPGVVQIGDPLTRDMTKMDSWGWNGSGDIIGIAEPTKRKFERGIVGLAYKEGLKPTSADSQLFILRAPNPALNGKYAAIGRVTKGMDVVDKIVRPDAVRMCSVRD
jgi:cyclophilin family peptidyl-prolyl cis-trans isomerase